jgi:DsbC/DsbD-like thiol-disulfide interchange protein
MGCAGLPLMDRPSADDDASRAEYETWHLHDAGGPMLRLKVRYRDDAEVPDWRDGPELAEALEVAAAAGWRAYDREPGAAPGEYAIFYMRREARPGRPAG